MLKADSNRASTRPRPFASIPKPKYRSRVRLIAGRLYYTLRRYMKWYLGTAVKYATLRQNSPLPEVIFTHSTPLFRQLRGVDMWLQHNKVVNLRLAVKRLDGVVIMPGETFSYWKLIGMPTRGKGYKEGMVLHPGTFRPGIGGGLCQLSNLIYWMTLHTPLTVTERYRHGYDVFPDTGRTQPFGSGATCVYNYVDLQLHNDTREPFQLCVHLTDTDLIGEWRTTRAMDYSYEIYEKEHSIRQEFWGGYVRQNTIFRRRYDIDGELVADEHVTSNVAIMMYEPFLTAGHS